MGCGKMYCSVILSEAKNLSSISACATKQGEILRFAQNDNVSNFSAAFQEFQALQSQRRKTIMLRKASAVWTGSLKEGKGKISTDSKVLSNAQYSFSTRFEDGIGTNPEELIAAAHAGCFSMALSAQLGNAGITPESIETTAAVTLEKTDAGFTITKVHLDVAAKIPGANQAAFDTAAQNAKAGCPISRLLKAEITMTAKLVGERASSA
jgi:osmotically inducible protein OsmC